MNGEWWESCSCKYFLTCWRTNIDSHKVAIAQRVHVFQHVTFIKHSVLQTQLTEEAAIAIVSDSQVVPVKQMQKEIKHRCSLESSLSFVMMNRIGVCACAHVVTTTLNSTSLLRMSCLR